MDSGRGFNLRIYPNDMGRMLVSGYLLSDGKNYSSEEGIVLSETCVDLLRNLELDKLPKEKHRLFLARDKAKTKLTLTYGNGKVRKKEIGNEMADAVCTAILGEFTAAEIKE